MRLRTALALGAAIVLASADALADGTLTYAIDEDASCTDVKEKLANALDLACDAARARCRADRGPEPARPDRTLRLDCTHPERWSVFATDASGALLWSADLTGPTEDRVRIASIAALRYDAQRRPAPAPVPAPAPPSPPPRVERTTSSSAPPPPDTTLAEVLVYGGFATAVVAGGIATGLAIAAKEENEQLERCVGDRACDPRQLDIEATRTKAVAADALIVTALVGAAAGITGLVLWPRAPEKPSSSSASSTHVSPLLGLGSVGLRGTF